MKTSVITDEISQNLEEAAEVAAAFGLNAIELRSVWNHQPHELDPGQIRRIRQICEEKGLKVCAISSPFFKCSLVPQEIECQLDILGKTIQVAQALDCRLIRGFSFWQQGDFEQRLPEIVAAFRRPAEMLRAAGMKMALEPDPSVFACNGNRLGRLIRMIDDPCIGALWDAGNDVYSPIPEIPFPDGYDFVKPYILHVHLKDAILGENGKAESVKIGTGLVNWPRQLAALKQDGYDGYLSLETHYRKGGHITDELLRLPGGEAFSLHGREASVECIQALQEIMQTV